METPPQEYIANLVFNYSRPKSKMQKYYYEGKKFCCLLQYNSYCSFLSQNDHMLPGIWQMTSTSSFFSHILSIVRTNFWVACGQFFIFFSFSRKRIFCVFWNQFGCMLEKSTMWDLYLPRWLLERYQDKKMRDRCDFVDLDKAYDRDPRKVIWLVSEKEQE